jgi:predicted metal-dependent hydrolase
MPLEFQLQNGSPAAGEIMIGSQSAPILLVRNERAKRYVLRVRPDGSVRLTIPRRGSLRSAREFAAQNIEWLKRQLERVASRRVEQSKGWRVGDEILFRGEKAPIELELSVAGTTDVRVADQRISNRSIEPAGDLRPSIEKHLRALAAAELPPRVWHFAAAHGVTLKRVMVRNQRSRWGSCSRHGTISLNWRLIQTPAHVSDYIILHELMHVRQMNHSRKFWREVEDVCPEFRKAENWLKANASLLRH